MFRRPGVIALIPARAGSKRMVGKNIRPLAGHPLIAYTIAAALESAIFTAIVVSHRLRADRGDRTLLWGRGAISAASRACRRPFSRHRVGGGRAETTSGIGASLRLLQHLAPHQPVPPGVHHPARVEPILPTGWGGLASCRREVQATPWQDVDRERRPHDATSSLRPPGTTMAQQPVPVVT